MSDMNENEAISFLEDFLKQLFGLEYTPEQVHDYFKNQEKAREKLGNDELTEPNLKRLYSKREKRLNDFHEMAEECIQNSEGIRTGRCVLNRNGGEAYEFTMTLKKVELPPEAKEKLL